MNLQLSIFNQPIQREKEPIEYTVEAVYKICKEKKLIACYKCGKEVNLLPKPEGIICYSCLTKKHIEEMFPTENNNKCFECGKSSNLSWFIDENGKKKICASCLKTKY